MDPVAQSVGSDLSRIFEAASPYLIGLGTLLVLYIFKDIINNVGNGILFMWGNDINHGTHLIIRGREARIDKAGLLRTNFFMYDNHTTMSLDNAKIRNEQYEIIAPPNPFEVRRKEAELNNTIKNLETEIKQMRSQVRNVSTGKVKDA